MTYCVGINLSAGFVLASDSRTNAGVDYVTSFSKTHCFNPAPDRIFILLSAGNLATTQEVLNRIQRDVDMDESQSLLKVRYLFEAADYIGKVSLAVQREHGPALASSCVSAETTFILAGQIAGQDHGLFMIYPQGNCFAATSQTPYLQIGENKYGKPAVDRIASTSMSLEEAARLALVSLDATARSNISVGPPFEITIYPKNSLAVSRSLKLDASDPLLKAIQTSWNQGIQRAFAALPRFPWETPLPQQIPFPQQAQNVQPLQPTQQAQQSQSPQQSSASPLSIGANITYSNNPESNGNS